MDLPTIAAHQSLAPTDWVPVSLCTLPTADLPLRVAEFDALFAASLRSVEYPAGISTKARLVLSGDAHLSGQVQRLVDAESGCCSFFTFTLTALGAGPPGDGDVAVLALDIEVPAAHADVLAALVQRAEQARSEIR